MSTAVQPAKRDTKLYDAQGNRIIIQEKIRSDIPNLDPNFLRGGRIALHDPDTWRARRPYASHSWTHACINRVATPISNLPKVLYRKSDPTNMIEDHPLLNLFQRPNPFFAGSDLWEYTIMCLLLPTLRTPGGQCFWHLESGVPGQKVDFKHGEIPKEIWPYSDHVIQPLHARNAPNKVTGWKMVINGQTKMEFDFDEIIRIRLINPYDPLLGLSPYVAAENPVVQDVKSDRFNTHFFDNFGAIGGLLTTESENVGREELQMYADWFDDTYAGAGNAGKTAALAHGLQYDQFMKSNVDMQFMEMRKDNRQRIQAVFGVNEEEIGIFEKGLTRATALQADRSVWQKTRLPLDKKIWSILNIMWIQYVKPGDLQGKSDLSRVEALQSIYTQQIEDAVRLIKDGHITPRESFRLTGVPVNDDNQPALDKVYISRGLVDAEVVNEIGYIPTGSQQSTEADKKSFTNPDEIQRIANSSDPASEILALLPDVVRGLDSDKRAELWYAHVRQVLDPGEKSMRKMINAHFYSLRNEMLDNIDAWLLDQQKAVRELEVDVTIFLFDMAKANEDLLALYKPETRKQMKRQLQKLKQDYGELIQWAVNEDDVDEFVKDRAKYLREVNSTTSKQARRVINDTVAIGIEESWTPQELARELKKALNKKTMEMVAGRSKTIARTEIGSISNLSNQAAFKSSEVDEQEWLSARDELVRISPYDHSIDGQKRKMGKKFTNGLRFPQEPGGAAGNVINCRCTTLPVFPEDA